MLNSFIPIGSMENTCSALEDMIVNRVTKATSGFGKLQYCLFNKRGINLETNITIHKPVVLITLFYESGRTIDHKLTNLIFFIRVVLGNVRFGFFV